MGFGGFVYIVLEITCRRLIQFLIQFLKETRISRVRVFEKQINPKKGGNDIILQ